jgi:3-demethoxyubiquinol 3-hydroxylase
MNKRSPRPPVLPGDRQQKPEKILEKSLARMLRVDQAGEYGAARIYAGQLAVLGTHHPMSNSIRHMAAQEQVHLDTFNQLLPERGVRPTLLQPFWAVAGYALGAATALISPKAAMACTVAIETVIDAHYQEQHQALRASEPELAQTIERFRQEEVEHRDSALAQGGAETLGYPLLSALIKGGCRLAIKLAQRL